MSDHFLSGTGTAAEDPIRSNIVTAPCSAWPGTALTFGGYFGSRCKVDGHEHVHHPRSLVRFGFGGTDEQVDGAGQVRHLLMKGDLSVAPSYFDQAQVDHNYRVTSQSMGEQHHRVPWRDDIQFHSDTRVVMGDGSERFRLTLAETGGSARGVFHRLLRRI